MNDCLDTLLKMMHRRTLFEKKGIKMMTQKIFNENSDVWRGIPGCGRLRTRGGEGYKIAEILRTSFMFLMKSYINVPVDSSFKP